MNQYYISNKGNDEHEVCTIETPWKSIEKMNSVILRQGDQILFRCGDCFSGELKIRQSGSEQTPIIVSSYGEGGKPVLTGSVNVKDWNIDKYCQFSAFANKPVYQLYLNNQLCNLARIPAHGFFSIESGDKNSLTDHQHLNVNYDLTGASLRIRAVNWQYETNKVASHKNGTITFAESMIYQANTRYGYLLDNKLEFLTQPGQWFWDEKSTQLHFISPSELNPSDEKIELTIFKNGITIGEKVSNIQISNLKLEKYDNAAILGSPYSSNVSVKNCKIRNINVYGICLEINSGNYTIEDNTICDILGRGISTLESSDNLIVSNIISRVGLSPGYGFDGVNNGIGIAVLKTEVKYKISKATFEQLKIKNIPVDILSQIESLVDFPYADEKFVIEALELMFGHSIGTQYIPTVMALVNADANARKLESTNNRVAYNVVDESGYAGIRLDGKNSIAEYNVIKNSLLHMNDGGALYCWAQNEDYSHHNIFRNNIIINAIGSCEATANDLAYAYGIYTDNKCHHITIENNTVVGTVGGILINDEAHHQKVIGNTLYDNQMGLVFSEYFMPDTLVGCEAYDNIIVAKKRNQRALFIECRIREKFVPGLLNRNLYASLYYPFPIVALTFKDDVRSFKEYTLESWKKHYKQDFESTTIATANHDAGGQQSEIFINETNETKYFDLPTDLIYTDLEGNALKDKIKVAPFSSVIILQK